MAVDQPTPRDRVSSLQLIAAKARYWLHVAIEHWWCFGAGGLIAIFIQMIGRR